MVGKYEPRMLRRHPDPFHPGAPAVPLPLKGAAACGSAPRRQRAAPAGRGRAAPRGGRGTAQVPRGLEKCQKVNPWEKWDDDYWWFYCIYIYISLYTVYVHIYIYNISLSLSLSLAFSLHIVQGVVDDDDDIFWHYFLEHIITTYNSLHIVIICYYHRWYYCVDDVDKENVRAHKHDK